ncbi:hypothetical protein D1007_34424 [Hordeum vulgare]|nr:hypothetical protein D1007_34424 [Hordeum vulgare]
MQSMAGRDGGNRFNRGDGAAEGRFGRGGGRYGRDGARDHGGGGGGRNLVWMRDNDEGGSSNIDPRHGSSDKARWDAEVMEQGDPRRSEKWGDSTAVAGAAGGKQPQIQERRHPTPGKRNTAPLVGGAEEKSEETQSEEESEDVDNVLLIDSMVAEAEKNHMKEADKQSDMGTSFQKIVVNAMQTASSPVIHSKFSSYLDACLGEPTVTEIKNDGKTSQEKEQTYFVQSPGEAYETIEVVPTPPVLEEVQPRFSKRNVEITMGHVGARAEKLAKKRNLQGNDLVSKNSFDVLSNMEIVDMAAHMGVNIPDDDFTVIDVIRELEKSRANIAKKSNTDIKQTEEMLLLTNAAGESSPLNTTWGDEGEIDDEGFKSVRSRQREKRKVNVVISKPVTRSQNQKVSGIAGKTMDPGKPSNKTHSPKIKKK